MGRTGRLRSSTAPRGGPMADVLLFHHALGLTDGVVAFADGLRAGGHRVTTPDLYEGRTFSGLEAGVAHAEEVGFDVIVAAGVAAAEALPERVVYAGMSLGVLPAQRLAQTRPGALGAVLLHAGVPVSAFGDWPERLALAAHTNRDDDWGDLDVLTDLVDQVQGRADAELFVYEGSTHLFTDSSTPDHDPASAALVLERVLAFLDRVGG
ncbi:MAG: dienelactone hydrolase family protein [Acidimicrobiia bacterium]